jgi:hypothetical protein
LWNTSRRHFEQFRSERKRGKKEKEMEKINNINYDNYVWIEEMGFADAENEWERTFLAVVLARHHPLHGCEMYNCPNLRKELVGAIKQQVDQKGKLISTNGLREALEDRIKVYCEI